jgi:hypothetical protein
MIYGVSEKKGREGVDRDGGRGRQEKAAGKSLKESEKGEDMGTERVKI